MPHKSCCVPTLTLGAHRAHVSTDRLGGGKSAVAASLKPGKQTAVADRTGTDRSGCQADIVGASANFIYEGVLRHDGEHKGTNVPVRQGTFVRYLDFSSRGKMRGMKKRFRDAFLSALENSDLSLAEIARRTGVSQEQLKKLKQRETASTNVDDAVKIAACFGQTLDEFLDEAALADRAEILRLWSLLDPEEQEILLASAQGIAARHHEAS